MKNIQLVKDYKDDQFKLVYAFEVDGDDVRIYEIVAQRMEWDCGYGVYAVEERIRDCRDTLHVGLSKSEAIEVAYAYIDGHLSHPEENGDCEEKVYYKSLQEELKKMEAKLR
jgi:hypothetical protein|tara:strand:+ start:368 stop:703 length:336 start_codon:yes stop_codon:yes gene_type:complete